MAKWLDNLKEVIVRLAGGNSEKSEYSIGEEASPEELREHFASFGVPVESALEKQLEQSLEDNNRTGGRIQRVLIQQPAAGQTRKPKRAERERGDD